MKISWTPRARITYHSILDFLGEVWTQKELQRFVDDVEKVLGLIKKNPEMFEASRSNHRDLLPKFCFF